MIIIDRALARYRDEGKVIRVGMVGAGFQASGIALQFLTATTGMVLSAVANRHLDKAHAAYAQAGVAAKECNTREALESAIAAGQPAVTEDALALAEAEGIDVVLEVTGSIEHAAQVIVAAIDAGKHVVHMNAELDGTVGPILKVRAESQGVAYTFADGDQPGVQMNLYRFVSGIGVTPVLCGNIKGLHDPYRNPDTQAAFALKWGQKPHMVASFADGTKISFEQAIVANATGMRVARKGMLGPDFSGGNPNAEPVQIEKVLPSFEPYLDPQAPGLVDYVVGARPGPGIFVIGHTDHPRKRHYLDLYKMGRGPYYCFYTPYHLCHFEVPNSVARAVLFSDVVLAPAGGPRVGVIAVAKKPLMPGDRIEDFGGFEVYGVAENMEVIRRDRLLPIGLALDATVKRGVNRDQALTFDDVNLPESRLVDELYREQECLFCPAARVDSRCEL